MKKHRIQRVRQIIACFLLCMVAAALIGTVTAGAEPTETYAVESWTATAATDIQTTATTAGQTTVPTATSTTATDPSESSSAATTAPPVTYQKPLPTVANTNISIPEVIGSGKKTNEPSLFWGFVSWICIGVGAAVIFAILLSTKTRALRSGGKKRYSTGDKLSGKKRLLSDEKYYDSTRRRR